MPKIKVTFDSNAVSWAEWCIKVPDRVKYEIEDRKLPYLKTATKREVQKNLFKDHGVDEGIYRKSFTINSFAENKWQIGFQVYAKKPHYRLTHLLEGPEDQNWGHQIVIFRWGQGRPTKWGNVGMVATGTRLHPDGHTRKVKHIEPAQKYAEERVGILFQEAYNGKLLERMNKIK